ncbi:putative transcription factor NAM family [Helianthus annuus]|uniref:Putative NAC domain-containing protein n=1 Tax=Helianthus annuus TaxID=4232 RepID=A0A251UA26_HELAN|nr:NAC domain-containing protein 83 [Helianthus annuus]KAF5796613.1 putative transcription factor NAM family [Helianthus annuus]KAJ0539901.1 putative transcription factor NAM family [Helianthus annuus]KAJ0548241.1 putative transcription factor NAM family [Helianthus annuus]KAJ0554636.1 putative transcription factor NAM family [Helianthus annuus]KAJ0720198.1 putative transcription factor NAM family [Helianthus annuus]
MSTHQNKHGEKVNMEVSKLNFVRDGATRLPPGFRFQPTDQEIVFQYLIRKVFSCPLPASIVPEIANICKFNPWDLPGDWEQDRYFFSRNEAKYGNGHRSNRASNDGYWKATGLDKQITRCCNNSRKKEIITGMKKTLVFYKGKAMHGESTTRTYWIMHEYRLVHSTYSPKTSSSDKRCWIQMGNWVLCHIFLNKRSRKVGVADGKTISSGLTPQKELLHHGFMISNDGTNVKYEPSSSPSESSSSSCGSSVVTHEVSSDRKSLQHDDNKNNVAT